MPDIIVTLQSYLATLKETHGKAPTQKELADLIQLSENNFSLIVNNKKKHAFTRDQLAAIISALRKYDKSCDISDLLSYVE